jgi:hypothetical protein
MVAKNLSAGSDPGDCCGGDALKVEDSGLNMATHFSVLQHRSLATRTRLRKSPVFA